MCMPGVHTLLSFPDVQGGRAVHKGGVAGMHTGEGPTEGLVPTHKVQIHDHYSNQVFNVEVPEDR